jgi:protein phosphatase methylesterase 1
MELRGHGKSETDSNLDFRIDTLVTDVLGVLSVKYANSASKVPIVLIGHSMGGSVAVHSVADADSIQDREISSRCC